MDRVRGPKNESRINDATSRSTEKGLTDKAKSQQRDLTPFCFSKRPDPFFSSSSFIFEQYLYDLCKAEVISKETAQTFASEQSILDQMILGSYSIPSTDAMLKR